MAATETNRSAAARARLPLRCVSTVGKKHVSRAEVSASTVPTAIDRTNRRQQPLQTLNSLQALQQTQMLNNRQVTRRLVMPTLNNRQAIQYRLKAIEQMLNSRWVLHEEFLQRSSNLEKEIKN